MRPSGTLHDDAKSCFSSSLCLQSLRLPTVECPVASLLWIQGRFEKAEQLEGVMEVRTRLPGLEHADNALFST
jgi:hypothetical protein